MSLGHRTKSYTTCVRTVESKLVQKEEGEGDFPPHLPWLLVARNWERKSLHLLSQGIP